MLTNKVSGECVWLSSQEEWSTETNCRAFRHSHQLNKCRWDRKAKRERNTHAAGLRRMDIFLWTSFLPLFIRHVQGTKRTNQEQRLYTQRSVKTRLSIVRVVWMCVNGMLVWTWVTDYSVCLCECVLCACLNSVRFATNDFYLHKTGFKTWMYIAARMLRWCFDRQRASTLKSESS